MRDRLGLQLAQTARDSGALIVHIQNDGSTDAPDEPGAPGWQLVIEPAAAEPVVRKQADDAFAGTGLEMLRDHGAASVTICGVQSEMCVAATARAAMQRGLIVVLPRDAHGTYPIQPTPAAA